MQNDPVNLPRTAGHDDEAGTLARGVDAGLQILKNGCWDPTQNAGVKPKDRNFAEVQGIEEIAKNWSSSFSLHSQGTKESGVVATVTVVQIV